MRYELYYWPEIQGRGEFVRLALEEAGVDYIDVARRRGGTAAMIQFLEDEQAARPPFAPPFLKVGKLVIAHTALILQYLGPRLGLVPRDEASRLPQTLNLGFPGLDGDALLMGLDLAGIAASLGSACASGSTRPSPTLLAMRVPDDRLRSSVRFSLGAQTTEAEIEAALPRIVEVVGRVARAGEEGG